MSNVRFLKYIPCDETSYLRENHPNAFLLLSLIAERARRISGKPDGLEIGEAQIGDYKKAGIETRDKYRTALDILIARKHVEKVETCRNRKSCPTGNTTIGTKVKLLNSGIWDINSEEVTHQNPHRIPTESPPNPHEQERTRKKKKEEETTTPPTPSKGDRVVVLYKCLQENNELSLEEKQLLQSYPEHRVHLALDFAKTEKPKTTLIQMLTWHCKALVPPRPSGKRLTDQQRLAVEFNAYLLSIGQELLYHENIKNIEDGSYILIPRFGCPQPISLRNDIKTLKLDFEEVKKEQRERERRKHG